MRNKLNTLLPLEKAKRELVLVSKEMEEVRSQIKPLNDKFGKLFEKHKKLQSEYDKLKLPEIKDDDWEYILHVEPNESTERYSFRTKKIDELGLMPSGYYPETNQTHVELKLIKGKPETKAKTIESLATILPFLKPIKDGKVHLGVFEHTLSEHGIYKLLIDKETMRCELTFTRYSRTSSEKTFENLNEAIEYIYDKHYYEEW